MPVDGRDHPGFEGAAGSRNAVRLCGGSVVRSFFSTIRIEHIELAGGGRPRERGAALSRGRQAEPCNYPISKAECRTMKAKGRNGSSFLPFRSLLLEKVGQPRLRNRWAKAAPPTKPEPRRRSVEGSGTADSETLSTARNVPISIVPPN